MAITPETKRLDTPEQFEEATGLKPTPDVWRPINTTPAKLAELKEQTSSLPQRERDIRTRAFIEANRIDTSQTAREDSVGLARTTPSIGAEVGGMVKDMVSEVTSEIKKPGFFKSLFGGGMKDWLKESLEGMLEVKKEGGIMGFFAGLGLKFFGKFGKDLGFSSDQMKEMGMNMKDGVSSVTQAVTERFPEKDERRKAMYSITTLALGRLMGNKDDKSIAQIFTLPKLADMKYTDIQRVAKNGNLSEIRNTLGIQENISDDIIKVFLSNLTDTESPYYRYLIEPYIKRNKEPKLNEATVFDIFSQMGTELQLLERIHSMDLSRMDETVENLGKNMLKYSPEKREVSGDLVEKAKGMGLTPGLMTKLIIADKSGFKDKSSFATIRGALIDESEKKKLDEIGAFGELFLDELEKNEALSFGFGPKIGEMRRDGAGHVYFEDIMKAYILTGGQTKLDNMTTPEKIGAYTAFGLIITSTSEGVGELVGHIFNVTNLADLFSGPSVFDKVPKDVQDTMGKLFTVDHITKMLSSVIGPLADGVAGFAKQSPGFTALLVILLTYLPIFGQRRNLLSIFRSGK